MKVYQFSTLLTMIFESNIWAVYGIGLEPDQNEGGEEQDDELYCTNCNIISTTATRSAPLIYVTTTDSPFAWIHGIGSTSTKNGEYGLQTATVWSQDTLAVDTHSPTLFHAQTAVSEPVVTDVPPAPPSEENDRTASLGVTTLSAQGAVGIGVGLAALVLLIAFLVIGIPHLRQWRRKRALQRAIDEVERGVELQKWTNGPGELSNTVANPEARETKEHLVLESRVEIIVEEEESEHLDVLDAWDGWDARESEDEERGRKGMSLPRRAD